jgi:hypothetical protein
MKSVFRLFVVVLLVAGWALAALSLHVVRTPEKIIVIPKNRVGYVDTYVDVRNWTPADVHNHASLAERLVATGRGEVLARIDGTTPATQPASAPIGTPI